jgi:hypothetical protein
LFVLTIGVVCLSPVSLLASRPPSVAPVCASSFPLPVSYSSNRDRKTPPQRTLALFDIGDNKPTHRQPCPCIWRSSSYNRTSCRRSTLSHHVVFRGVAASPFSSISSVQKEPEVRYKGRVVLKGNQITAILLGACLLLLAIYAGLETRERIKSPEFQFQRRLRPFDWRSVLRLYLQELWRDVFVATLVFFAVWTLIVWISG